MKQINQLLLVATAMILFASCQKFGDFFPKDHGNKSKGDVYTLSNQAAANEVIQYVRNSDGTLQYKASYPTGELGTGAGLGSQGALIFAADNHILLAVNAGSNSVSAFRVKDNGLELINTVQSGGTQPISIAAEGDLVYVLNAGSPANISGFKLTVQGLQPLSNSTRPLSGDDVGPAQVSFVLNGKVLVITEKGTNLITTYTINGNGRPQTMHTAPSASPTPFGFATGKNGLIVVSEAAGGAPGISAVSTYHVNYDGVVDLITGPVSAGQTAACWVVLTDNGKIAYATNTGDSNVSSFSVNHNGELTVDDAAAGLTGTGSKPIDASLSANSKYLYVLSSGTQTVTGFRVQGNGSLSQVDQVSGLPAGTVGLASE